MAHETVERFPQGAGQEVKAGFAKDLMAALDKVNVKPGDDFYVMPSDELDKLKEGYDDEVSKLRDRVHDAEHATDELRALEEAVEDFARGIVTKEELLEKVGVRL